MIYRHTNLTDRYIVRLSDSTWCVVDTRYHEIVSREKDCGAACERAAALNGLPSYLEAVAFQSDR